MSQAQKIRFGFIAALWLLLCYIIVSSSPRITPMTIFAIVTSGIVTFVPLYKKYIKGPKDGK